jgi:hypothetical protein
MSRWWSIGAVVVVVFMLGCCALSLSLKLFGRGFNLVA